MNIPVLLLFDGGPHNANGDENRTLTVINKLNAKSIKACFFIQTRAKPVDRLGVAPIRMSTYAGEQAVRKAKTDGHVIQIGSGALVDFASHTERVLERPESPPAGNNALETDLRRAMQVLNDKAIGVPAYVRPIKGTRNAEVVKTYSDVGLRYVGARVDSGDMFKVDGKKLLTPQEIADLKKRVEDRLVKEVSRELAEGAQYLTVMFHDVARVTALHLDAFIDKIQSLDARLKFVSATLEAQDVLERAAKIGDPIKLTNAAGQEILDGEQVMIDKQASMPKLTAALKTPQVFPIQWQLTIRYQRSNRDDRSQYSKVVAGSGSWNINAELGADVRGGEATLHAIGTGAGEGYEAIRTFSIRAENPDDSAVEAFIGTNPWFGRYIARHESGDYVLKTTVVNGKPKTVRQPTFYNQFNERGDSDVRGTPMASFDYGFGIFQLTKFPGPPTEQQLWSWKANVTAGMDYIRELLDRADKYMNAPATPALPQGGQRVKAANQMGAPQPVPDVPYGDVVFKDGTACVIEHAIAIKMFNGATKPFCVWDATGAAWTFNPLNTVKPPHGPFNYVERVCLEVQ